MAARAAASVFPVTLGTWTKFGPEDHLMWTVWPFLSFVPLDGSVSRTRPAFTVEFATGSSRTGFKPAADRRLDAAAVVMPVTSGTLTNFGPLVRPRIAHAATPRIARMMNESRISPVRRLLRSG